MKTRLLESEAEAEELTNRHSHSSAYIYACYSRTMQFSVDRKRQSHKQNQCSASATPLVWYSLDRIAARFWVRIRLYDSVASENQPLREVANIVIWLGNFWYFGKLVAEERWSQPGVQLHFKNKPEMWGENFSAFTIAAVRLSCKHRDKEKNAGSF